MRTLLKSLAIRTLALMFAASVVTLQASAQDRVQFRQEELDQMLAPVALYPDALLSQVLMASTYPLEVVQAARWSRANPGYQGQDAVRAVEGMDWDSSVKSLTAFPQILTLMDEKIEWTGRLGEAFLAQQSDVMDTVQGLRRRAETAGNLRSNEQIRVARQDGAIVIEPPAPNVVYVPYYDPFLVYGPWWWASYPPVFWAPWPAYYGVSAYRPVFLWGPGIVISAGFFFGHFNWHHRHVDVVHVHHPVQGRPTPVHARWTHDPVHRRGAPFRNAEVRQRFGQSRSTDRDQISTPRQPSANGISPGIGSPVVTPRGMTPGIGSAVVAPGVPLPARGLERRSEGQQPDVRRAERRDVPRQQLAPVARFEPRQPAVARAAPAAMRPFQPGERRVETLSQGGPTRAAPPQRPAVREAAPIRPSASAAHPAPRVDHSQARGAGRAQGQDNRGQRDRSAHGDGNRKS